MEGMLSSAQSLLMLLGVLVIQYFLVKRPQKWMAFILPALYFGLSIRDVVLVK